MGKSLEYGSSGLFHVEHLLTADTLRMFHVEQISNYTTYHNVPRGTILHQSVQFVPRGTFATGLNPVSIVLDIKLYIFHNIIYVIILLSYWRNRWNWYDERCFQVILQKGILRGPLAQLVERFHGMEEVAGPNPAWSTEKTENHQPF